MKKMMATARYLMVYSCFFWKEIEKRGRGRGGSAQLEGARSLSLSLSVLSYFLRTGLTARTRPPLRRKLGAKRAITLYDRKITGKKRGSESERKRRRGEEEGGLSSLVFDGLETHITTPIPMMNLT